MPHLDEMFSDLSSISLQDEQIIMNHTALRIKDKDASLKFYCNILGMKLTKVLSFGGLRYYMLVYRRYPYWTEQSGVLTLCYQTDPESDPKFKVNIGENTAPGFAHLYVSGDLNQTGRLVARIGRKNFKETAGIDGFMKTYVFTDPDGYRIIWKYNMDTSHGSVESPMLSRTVLRVKNPLECVDFYRNFLGMKLYLRHDDETARISLYFLGYLNDNQAFKPLNLEGSMDIWDVHFRSGILELQYLWDTSGKSKNEVSKGLFQGFSHIGFSVADLHEFCTELANERGANLEWEVDENNDGTTEIVVKTKDPAGNSIHFISRTYYSEKRKEYVSDSLGEGDVYLCEETREMYWDFLESDY